jgi:hypothetical protein
MCNIADHRSVRSIKAAHFPSIRFQIYRKEETLISQWRMRLRRFLRKKPQLQRVILTEPVAVPGWTSTMMAHRQVDQADLFNEFSLERQSNSRFCPAQHETYERFAAPARITSAVASA